MGSYASIRIRCRYARRHCRYFYHWYCSNCYKNVLHRCNNCCTSTRSSLECSCRSLEFRHLTIEFSAKSGDAKKLTFKYTDTIGTERQASTVMSSTGVALTNTVGSTTASTN